ncbi:hypothetical protein ACIPX0_38325 [Streptomyces sp. NPDC090075]|uniref:hypothetical protein n=1 Tax=Streptomyces sp. NPDC090075 TaxID=3365937 RepID=UPI00381C5593
MDDGFDDMWGGYLQDEWRRERFIKAVDAMAEMNAERRTRLREDMAAYIAGKAPSTTLRDSFRKYIEKEAANGDGRSTTPRPGPSATGRPESTTQAATERDRPGDDDSASPGTEPGTSD